jgi:hypothetical protein
MQQSRPFNVMVSILQPAPLGPPLSVAQRQRKLTVWPAALAGKLTVVVTNPTEFPLQACRFVIGLWNVPSMVLLYPPATNDPPAATIS